jgi:hypothetical protein
VEYQSDISHVIEQMGAALRLATRRFAEGAPAQESIDATNQALALVVDLPATTFVGMSPQTMLSLLEMSGSDDRVLEKVAEALLLQADVFEAEGSFIEARARKDQAAAVLGFIDPSRAN